jgi:hypothetical protein
MHSDTKQIAPHMKEFGLCLLGRSVVDVTFGEQMNRYAHAMGAMRGAHAAEIIIKARIAEEHPLLIFKKCPKSNSKPGSLLSIKELLNDGQTLMYNELPEVLWATTGQRIPNPKQFSEFGHIRNLIAHFAVPPINLTEKTLQFAFQVMEPMIFAFWNIDIFEYIAQYNQNDEECIHEQLKQFKISYTRRL